MELDLEQHKRMLEGNKEGEKIAVNENIVQKYIFIPQQVDEYYLLHLIQKNEGIQMIVFVNKCYDAHLYNLMLQKMEVDSTVLHSLLSQKQRTRNIRLFKNRKKKVLITTDISSRGIDIPNCDLVINYQLPRSYKDYLHRIGRTGRNNRNGQTVSLVTQYDLLILENLQSKMEGRLKEMKLDEEKIMEGA